MKNSDTLLLMKVIGIPNIQTEPIKDLNEATLIRLFPLAVRNKVPLLFLENALDLCKDSNYLQSIYEDYAEKSQSAKSLIKEIAEALVQNQVDYVIFKTIKPFRSVGADVDVIFFSRQDLTRAWYSLQEIGCKLAGYGAFSVTLYNPTYKMNVDLHLQMSVSRLVYMNKQLLQEYVTETNFNGALVPVFENPASLVIDAAHSIHKEQLFMLSDYYTTIFETSNMNKQQRKSMMNLAELSHVAFCLKAVLMLVDKLTAVAFKKNISAINEMAQMVHVNKFEDKAIRILITHFEQNLKLPYKYHPMTVAVAFMARVFKDPMLRGTLAGQFKEMVTNMPYLLENTLLHVKRETY